MKTLEIPKPYTAPLFIKLISLKLITFFLAYLGLLSAEYFFSIEFEWDVLYWVLVAGTLAIIAGLFWYYRSPSGIGSGGTFFMLSTDILFLSGIVFFTGGTLNPFSSSILVPLAISMTLLPKRASFTLVVVCIAIYAVWTFGGDEHAHHHVSFELHLYGMWINFFVSAILLYIFVIYAMAQMKSKERLLGLAREKILKDEQLVGIATLTAGTAHSLGTPLSTMTLLLEDVDNGEQIDAESLQMLKDQIYTCKSYINGLVSASKQAHSVEFSEIEVGAFAAQLREHVNLLFPQAHVDMMLSDECKACVMKFSQTLFFAIANLVDNAIQNSRSKVKLEFLKEKVLVIKITDDGAGFSQEQRENFGQPFFSTKKEGFGVGIFLTSSTIENAGGHLTVTRSGKQGATVEVTIPFAKN